MTEMAFPPGISTSRSALAVLAATKRSTFVEASSLSWSSAPCDGDGGGLDPAGIRTLQPWFSRIPDL